MDLFSIGIGPSSSHTVGPMRAGYRFCQELIKSEKLADVERVTVDLFGSLALTGKGHATDIAVLLGLSGQRPRTVNPDAVPTIISNIREGNVLLLAGEKETAFVEETQLNFHYNVFKPEHPNAMEIKAFDAAGTLVYSHLFFSVGGGFVVDKAELEADPSDVEACDIPYPFGSGEELLAHGDKTGLTIAEIMLANEVAMHGEADVMEFLELVRDCMLSCIDRGCKTEGILPGGLDVERRAYKLHQELVSRPEAGMKDPLTVLDWVNLFALAVNEENAAGGRVVTAPTNGAAGVIPAVLAYYERFCPNATDKGSIDFLLTAAAIGSIYKKRASISAAEVGCQGEVGVACSMAAGALCAVMGGTNQQIENAAEIGMEHNLGLTCDPIGGLVQVPCIERNTMGATKAINASRLALRGDGSHKVSLDKVIETMRQTGMDMQSKYKETSQGGLAVNVVEC
ncbi:L-serine ammonia-lyase [Terasakiella sp. A23]|uniref:L-serine ammonia-lyase n=1 Tax=Terasakiella sp. FCG-A23 TaxID=3080561 RepID=UPI0029539D0E|nr:L-serine ammonia-lyase [Terasakiella sp. A23]MDV7339313.1 L-serine ammonia-lyase [Terasakiella sp. A23]